MEEEVGLEGQMELAQWRSKKSINTHRLNNLFQLMHSS